MDDCIDPVGITFGILESLQYQYADAFAQNRAVGIGGKRAGVAGVRKDAGFGKAHVHENIVDGVHATGDHHVAFSGSQFHQSQMNGTQTAGTGCIHDAVGAAKIQPVADPACHHITKQSGEGILLPGYITFRNIIDDGRFLLVAESFVIERLAPHGMPQA